MKLFFEFNNRQFGDYDIILHASEDDMKEILNHFEKADAVPDILSAKWSRHHEDLYLFFIDSKARIITPVWSFNYAYGHMYYESPVGEKLPDFSMDLNNYSFRMFSKVDEQHIERGNLPRDMWPDKHPVFRGKDIH